MKPKATNNTDTMTAEEFRRMIRTGMTAEEFRRKCAPEHGRLRRPSLRRTAKSAMP